MKILRNGQWVEIAIGEEARKAAIQKRIDEENERKRQQLLREEFRSEVVNTWNIVTKRK